MNRNEVRPRNSCKAIIIEDGRLLVIQKRDGEEIYFVLPGGGQRHGETFIDTVKRECIEELGIAPNEIGELLFIREYIGANHEFPRDHKHVHQIEYMFECEINSTKIGNGKELDKGQEDLKWLDLDNLHKYNFYPRMLKPELLKYKNGIKSQIYLGDIN